jgi:acetyl esterase/lipase
MNITSRHWVFLEDLCRHTHATIVIPDYPLAPASTWEDVYACVETAYGRLVETIASDQVVVMGDSAGEGCVWAWSRNSVTTDAHYRSRLSFCLPGSM